MPGVLKQDAGVGISAKFLLLLPLILGAHYYTLNRQFFLKMADWTTRLKERCSCCIGGLLGCVIGSVMGIYAVYCQMELNPAVPMFWSKKMASLQQLHGEFVCVSS
jgi:hypothetical protein